MSISVQHQYTVSIDITPSASPTYTEITGLMDFTEALNEVVQQYQFLDKGGFGESEITGMQPILTVTGIRKFGDAGQDYVFSKKYDLLEDRKTNLRVTYNNGTQDVTIDAPVTLGNIQEFSGAATDGTAISFEIHFNDKPTVTGGAVLALLTVVSVAGTAAGDTAIYVNPALTGGNNYRYQVAASVVLPAINQDVSSLTAWNGTDDITAATGQEILIVEATAGNLAVKAGIATVTSA